jgi:hypothetical protein
LEIDKFGETTERARMFIVAVGVSSYANPDWRLKYAANDAKAIGDTLTAVAHDLYAEPKVVPVLDKDVSMSLLSDNPVCALFEPWVVREKRSKSSM